MTVTVKKLGGSVAVVIPREMAREMQLTDGTALEVTATVDAIVMRKRGRRQRRDVAQIVSRIKPGSYRRRRTMLADSRCGRGNLVSKRTYHPDRGDLIELNFQPAAGREIDKRRPAIVLSPVSYNRKTGMCLAVPVSSDLTPGPLWIPMPDGYLPRPSLILCDYIKSFDYRERSAVFVKQVPNELIDQIVGNVMDLIDPVR